MRRFVMVLLPVALLAGSSIVHTAGAAPGCRHLLVDPVGDADHMGLGDPGLVVEDGAVVDLTSVDLASDRTALHVVIRVKGRNLEGGTDYLDHSWSASFSTESERFDVSATLNRVGGAHYDLYRVIAGSDVPQDEEGPSASAGEGVRTTIRGSIDEAGGVIRMSVPLSAFAEFGGLGSALTRVRSITWSGNGVHEPQGGSGTGTFGSTDFGSTRASYVVGSKGCTR